MKRWKLMFATMMMAAMFVLSACGGGSSLVGGRWVDVDPRFMGTVGFEFFSDGTVVGSWGAGRRISGQWTAEGGRLVFDGTVWSYNISGNTLTLESDGGSIRVFERER